MYIAISLRKIVQNKAQAEKLVDDIRERVKDIEELEIAAQLVDKMAQEMTTPCTTPIH